MVNKKMCNECGGKGKKNGEVKDGEKPSTSVKAPREQQRVAFQGRKGPQPVINLIGNITGMQDKGGPMTKMKMNYKKEENKTPELNIDIDLTKDDGPDETFCLSSEPTKEELEERQHRQLRAIECELEGLMDKLSEARRLRKDWNAQKEGLCNRKLKDLPKLPPSGPC